MLRRPAGNKLGLLSFQSLPCRRPFLPYPCAVLTRYQSNWSRDYPREPSKPNSERIRDSKRDEKYRGDTHTLDVDSLGKPGQIVVVPPRRRRIDRNRKQDLQNEPHSTISSILDDLDDENSSLSDSSVQERIDEIRESYHLGETLPARVFKALWSQLASSFTNKQLSDYISEYRRNVVLEDKGWTWSQGKGSASSKGLKGKAMLADTIVRDCWQLVVDGELGQLEFSIPIRSISLLLHAEHFSFHELASLHGCGIEVIQSEGVVLLTGKRNECESVREVIIDSTVRIREDDLGFSASTHGESISQTFNSEFLEWVNNTYGVFVEHKGSKFPEKILYLAENKLGAENARRTLNLALCNNITSPSTPFSTYLPASEFASAYSYKPDIHASWFERQKSWFRWAMSSSQNAEAESLETPFFDKHQTRLSDELLKLLRVDVPNTDLLTGLHESVAAVVGKCLFMQKQSFDDPAISPAQLGKLSLPRTFTNGAPLVSSFINSLSPIPPKNEAQLYRFRLSPTSNTGSLPELEIAVAMNSNSDGIDIHSVKAILATNSVDYLLPENGLDLRFTRTVSQDLFPEPSHSDSTQGLFEHTPHEALPSPETQALLQSLKSSLQSSFSSSEASGSPVPPPTFCNISLPRDLAQQHAFQKTQTNESGEPISEDSVTVEYMFPPLNDIRGAIVQKYDFDGRPLDYQYYESGPFLSARTHEVTLGMETDQSELLDNEFHSFYNAACDMAFKIHNSGHTNERHESLFD
ncbi:hypothetical protein N7457_009270 [Penicillium paradoxum]|uniref:uncharacterized protein n=1 Tax=Penicillium paradoxum TaxID=176176 RepID=UPI00254748DA|nr:uncharacterized protein N7457_009270 [Penicillium paradoxum]KAJ5774374.1 hypothetical protein N7457_009270 [Penicillium paradoxum]